MALMNCYKKAFLFERVPALTALFMDLFPSLSLFCLIEKDRKPIPLQFPQQEIIMDIFGRHRDPKSYWSLFGTPATPINLPFAG